MFCFGLNRNKRFLIRCMSRSAFGKVLVTQVEKRTNSIIIISIYCIPGTCASIFSSCALFTVYPNQCHPSPGDYPPWAERRRAVRKNTGPVKLNHLDLYQGPPLRIFRVFFAHAIDVLKPSGLRLCNRRAEALGVTTMKYTC